MKRSGNTCQAFRNVFSFLLIQKELMCKLVGIKSPAEYHVLKEAVFSKLEKDKSQLEAVEW